MKAAAGQEGGSKHHDPQCWKCKWFGRLSAISVCSAVGTMALFWVGLFLGNPFLIFGPLIGFVVFGVCLIGLVFIFRRGGHRIHAAPQRG